MSDTTLAQQRSISTAAGPAEPQSMSRADLRHNMTLLVLIEVAWLFGITEMQTAANPLYNYLNASNTMVGLIGFTFIIGVIGVLLSPFITIRFPIKKKYLLVAHIPYLLPWAMIGLCIIFSRSLALTNEWLIWFILAMNATSGLAAGFVTLPHQEYVAACIPMSHRGRLSGYGSGLGAGLAICSSFLAWHILRVGTKPDAYGYLYLMTWFICQTGYILALFARERPTPVEDSPKPWSKTMIKAAFSDKPYLRVILLQFIYYALFMPLFTSFIGLYGLKELHMADETSASINITKHAFSLGTCFLIGHLIDRLSPKRFFHHLPWAIIISLAPVLIWRNPIVIYVSIALSQIVWVGALGGFNALVYGLPSPENRAGHFTFQIFALYCAQALGPLFVGHLCDLVSYRSAFMIVLGLAFLLLPLSRYLLAPLSTRAEDYS